MKKTAELISIILGPAFWMPFIFFLVFFRSGLSVYQLKILLPTIFLLEVAIPLAYLYIAPRIGWATKWDLPKREERYPFLALVVVTASISLIIISFFGTKTLFGFSIILSTLLLVSTLISHFWKISLHVSLNVVGSLLTNFVFSWKLPILYLAIIVILWARYELKKHSLIQLLVPVALDSAIIFVLLYLFGYVSLP